MTKLEKHDKQLIELITKNFKVYVDDELTQEMGFLRFINILHDHSDFFNWSIQEQVWNIGEWLYQERIYINDKMYIEIYP